MSLSEKFDKYKKRILGMKDNLEDMTEEATKNALIMPFFTMLGYDVFDPQEFVPEFICDVGTKKGEKIDYAIMHDGEPIMLIEAKRAGMKLQKQQQGQLFRYFSVNRCRIAILTNGLQYNIYSDINAPNVMDDEPFLTFNILNDDPSLFLQSLEQLTKEALNISGILSKAIYLKYSAIVEKTIKRDLTSPSDELVKYFLTQPEINTGKRITAQTINKYREVTAEALRKVMGTTLNISSQASEPAKKSSTTAPKEENTNTSQTISAPPEVLAVIEKSMGTSSYTYSDKNGLSKFEFEKICVCVPKYKSNHFVVFTPSKLIFAYSLAELEIALSALNSNLIHA